MNGNCKVVNELTKITNHKLKENLIVYTCKVCGKNVVPWLDIKLDECLSCTNWAIAITGNYLVRELSYSLENPR